MRPIASSPQLFALLSALVEERTGLHFAPSNAEAFWSRVVARVQDVDLDSALDYYYLLRYDDPAGAELQRLVDLLVVHETFFFRELDHLRLAVTLLGERAAAGHRPRCWSAACATGEEPVSLAVLLAEAGLLEGVELVASDISPRVLERARSGRFSRRALRDGHPEELARRWLRVEPDAVVAPARLVDAIAWRRVNLLDGAAVAALGPFDVILCRNVLFYFQDETTRAVARRLGSALVPGGGLVVGVSESLLRLGTGLEPVDRDGTFYYRRPS